MNLGNSEANSEVVEIPSQGCNLERILNELN